MSTKYQKIRQRASERNRLRKLRLKKLAKKKLQKSHRKSTINNIQTKSTSFNKHAWKPSIDASNTGKTQPSRVVFRSKDSFNRDLWQPKDVKEDSEQQQAASMDR